MSTVLRKPDSDEIRSFLKELENQDWIRRTERSWWPRFVFHFTDIQNTAQILREGELLCRRRLEGRLPVDSASPDVIDGTHGEVLHLVRLYFRPRTPTQYHMEGIRPSTHLSQLGSHCPVPVFFLFDSAEILTRADCKFTAGNLATLLPPELKSSANELREFPFQQIYHIGPFAQSMRLTIVFHRNAEVVVPGSLDLSALRFLVCCSPAEKDTLLSLLPPALREQYRSRIRVARAQLYFKKWTFIEEVSLSSEKIVIKFSPDSDTPGPFRALFQLDNLDTGAQDVRDIPDFNFNDYPTGSFWIELPLGQPRYRFRLELDSHLAYQNEYEESIPF